MATRFWGDRKFTDVQMHPERVNEPREMGAKLHGKKVFVCDVSDLFHESVSFDFITRIFIEMTVCEKTTFQVLTKRPHRVIEWIEYNKSVLLKHGIKSISNPSPNIWIGTSVENQEQADIRIPLLLQIPAAVRFLSCEPLIGELLLIKYFSKLSDRQTSSGDAKRDWFEGRLEILPNNSIHWVIAGGESGHGARPMHPNWVRFLKNQCESFNVPFFFKQWGQWLPHCHVTIRGTALEVFKRTYKSVVWSDAQAFYRTGKKESGNLLDGKQHLAFPNINTSTPL
jgi:protein gp37